MLVVKIVSGKPTLTLTTANNTKSMDQKKQSSLEERVRRLEGTLREAVTEMKRLRIREKFGCEHYVRLTKLVDKASDELAMHRKTQRQVESSFLEENKRLKAELGRLRGLLKLSEEKNKSICFLNDKLRKEVSDLTVALEQARTSKTAPLVMFSNHLEPSKTPAHISTAVPVTQVEVVSPHTVIAPVNQRRDLSFPASATTQQGVEPVTSCSQSFATAEFNNPSDAISSVPVEEEQPGSPDVVIISPPTPAVTCSTVLNAEEQDHSNLQMFLKTKVARLGFLAPCWEPGGDVAPWWSDIVFDANSEPPGVNQETNGASCSM